MPPTHAQTVAERRSRYLEVLNPILNRTEFTAQEIQGQCAEAAASFVTRLLNQLAEEGVLSAEDWGKNRRFRWISDRRDFSPSVWVDRQLFGTQIAHSPVEERPRERLLRLGPESLRTAELLAILIRTGRRGESALDAGERIANRAAHNVATLREWAPLEYKEISSAVSETAFCQIMAGIELGRRVAAALQSNGEPKPRLQSSALAMEYCQRHFARLAADARHEEFHIVTLDTKLQPLQSHQISVGTLDASLVAPREVFRPAIRDAAAAILLVHNHPSGDPTPSRQDFSVTDSLDAVAKVVGIQIIDHIIVAGQKAISLREWKTRTG